MAKEIVYKNPRLLLLIDVAEAMFHMPKGQILHRDRWQPPVNFRQIAMFVAHEAGFNYNDIGRAFERHRSSVSNAVCKARDMRQRSAWWDETPALLNARWEAAIQRRKSAEARAA